MSKCTCEYCPTIIVPGIGQSKVDLYSEDNKFIEIRGDSLRDEIVFYKINCTDNEDRIEKVKIHIMKKVMEII